MTAIDEMFAFSQIHTLKPSPQRDVIQRRDLSGVLGDEDAVLTGWVPLGLAEGHRQTTLSRNQALTGLQGLPVPSS